MYNEVDLMILESFLECPQCNSKEFTLEGLTTTIVASHNYEDADHHNHEHDGNCMDAFYSCANRHLCCLSCKGELDVIGEEGFRKIVKCRNCGFTSGRDNKAPEIILLKKKRA